MTKEYNKPTRIARLSVWFYEKVILSAAMWSALAIFGVMSYTVFLQKQGFPAVDVPVSIVQATYFVDDKSKVDSEIAKPIVDAAGEIDGVKSTSATSLNNQATVVVEYADSLNSSEGSKLVEERVASLNLPDSARLSFQAIDAARFNNKYDILVTVASSVKTAEELELTAEELAVDLKQRLPDAVLVETIPLFTEGVNPQTGQSQKLQTSFDWTGVANESGLAINQSVAIGLQTRDDEDLLSFDDKLNQAISQVSSSEQYSDVSVQRVAGFAPSIREQISSLQENLFAGLAIVIIVCFIFIGLRAGLLAALSMFMTLSVTAGILYVTGFTLNTITLFALVLCLGLIVDDTIIMIEAIDSQRKKGKSLKDSIISAVKRVAMASASGTLTTILGFAPLLFIGGILGSFIRVLPLTIIISLLVSLIISILFVPFMSRWFLSNKTKTSRANPLVFIRRSVQLVGNVVAGFIESARTRRQKITRVLIAVVISFTFIGATGPLFAKLKFDIFPTPKDTNALRIDYTFAPDVTFSEAVSITESANQQIADAAGDNIETITYLGSANNRQATANVTLIPYSDRAITSGQIVEQIKAKLGSTERSRIVVSEVSAGPPKDDFPFSVQIPADNPSQAASVAENLVAFLQDRSIVRGNGTEATIIETEYVGERASITRVDGQRVIQVSAAFNAEDTSALVQAAQEAVENEFALNPENLKGLSADDLTYDFGSESDNQESFASVLFALPILILAMYLLLAFQFKSFSQPLLILVAVPFSFFGVAIGLLLTENPFSFFVMIAFFALIGISVNNTILLTDYANQGRRQGLSPRQAMVVAVKERIRPLITTSLTSVLALLPLALTDPFWESLAVTLIGGLAASTFLVIVSFPYYYLALEALRSRFKQRRLQAKRRRQGK